MRISELEDQILRVKSSLNYYLSENKDCPSAQARREINYNQDLIKKLEKDLTKLQGE
jgi:hypothetical protein